MTRMNLARGVGALLSLAAANAFAEAQIVPPAASGAISGMYSGTNPMNAAPRPTRDDGQLLGAIVSALASDPALRGAELQVEVDQGVVGITGRADSAAQAQRAGRVAAEAARGARVETDIDTP